MQAVAEAASDWLITWRQYVPYIKRLRFSRSALYQSALHLGSWTCSMAGEAGRGRHSRQTVAVTLALFFLAQSVTCFSLRALSKEVEQDKVGSEATVMEVRTGRIFFNGKELDSQSGSASAAATGNDRLLHADLDGSDGTGEMLLSSSKLMFCTCRQHDNEN